MYAADFSLQFSRGKEAANYLKSMGLDKAYIIGTTDFSMSPISGELDQPIFYMEQMAMGTYTRWDKNRHSSFDSAQLEKALKLAPVNKPVVFICSYPVTQLAYFSQDYTAKPSQTFQFGNYYFKLLKHFEAGIEKYEGYWLFEVTKPSMQSH